jgi:spermidine synthase
VTRDGKFRTLRHGVEVHGAQQIADAAGKPLAGKPKPLTYYHEESPISEAIDAARAHAGGGPINIGVVGLGAGSIACLTDPGDKVNFYEIDPVVVRLARDAGKFSFVSACTPDAGMILGDARLTLAEEKARYHVLILDAFSSDSIPAHLLTREALAIYMERLLPDGLLVLHISNNHLRLNEAVVATARSLGLEVRLHDEEAPDDPPEMTIQPTVAVAARRDEAFGDLDDNDEWREPETANLPPPWTDDFSNLFSALLAKLRER